MSIWATLPCRILKKVSGASGRRPGAEKQPASATAARGSTNTAGTERTLVSLLGSDEFPCCVEILGADEDLAPASEAASTLGRDVGCPVGAANFVSAQERADDVGLALTPNDRYLYDVRHTPSLAWARRILRGRAPPRLYPNMRTTEDCISPSG